MADPGRVARCARVAMEYYSYTKQPVTRDQVYVWWFFGESGTGKTYNATRMAKEIASKVDSGRAPYVCSPNLRWWSGYDGQKVVIIDELRWQSLGEQGIPYLLRLIDKGPLTVEVKGGHVFFGGVYIFITAQDDPDVTFRHGDDGKGGRQQLENIGQVIRRLTHIIEFGKYYDSERNICTTLVTDVTHDFRKRFGVLHTEATYDGFNFEEFFSRYGPDLGAAPVSSVAPEDQPVI